MSNLTFFVYCFMQGFVSFQSNFCEWQKLMKAKNTKIRNRFFYGKLNETPSLIKYSEKNEDSWHFLDWIGNMEVYQCPLTNLYWIVYKNNGYGGMRPARDYKEMLEVCKDMEATCW